MRQFTTRPGLLIKDFATFVSGQSEQIKEHAKAVADLTG